MQHFEMLVSQWNLLMLSKVVIVLEERVYDFSQLVSLAVLSVHGAGDFVSL